MLQHMQRGRLHEIIISCSCLVLHHSTENAFGAKWTSALAQTSGLGPQGSTAFATRQGNNETLTQQKTPMAHIHPFANLWLAMQAWSA